LYMLHAVDEYRHGILFRRRAASLLHGSSPVDALTAGAEWVAAAGHGLDDLTVEDESDETMLAFLHVAEKSAANRFMVYRDALQWDPATRAVFEEILHDEVFHMNYTLSQLVRVSPQRHRWQLWRARLSRLWKAYLRLASAIAAVLGPVILTIQNFVVVPAFAFFAKRAERNESSGWKHVAPERNGALKSEY
jgi:Asp-tRNA(Asn)/Glu-tRNA(Gln) amidotransferase A subunit family amidase